MTAKRFIYLTALAITLGISSTSFEGQLSASSGRSICGLLTYTVSHTRYVREPDRFWLRLNDRFRGKLPFKFWHLKKT